MSKWSLPIVLSGLHDHVQDQLKISRRTFNHPGTKGDASESVWATMLRTYLPRRYEVAKAHVVDSAGTFSEQIDVVVFDRQYSPFVVHFNDQIVLPAESVYAAFESKQEINAKEIKYAGQKVASVRKLHRTSLPIPHAGGTHRAKKPSHILGGLLTFESSWTPALGAPLKSALDDADRKSRLDIGCVAKHGVFWSSKPNGRHKITPEKQAATAFLLELISRLQEVATVPMIDVRAYAKWLGK